jgi:hypothetical protein
MRHAPNRWILLSALCGLVFPLVLLLVLSLSAVAPSVHFPFFQGAVALITIVPTAVALVSALLAFAGERKLLAVVERRTLYRLAVAVLALAAADLLATIVLVLWGVITSTVATGGSPF